METTNNLPSLFRSLRTSCHSPLISTAELERLILHDKALENDTKGYREAITSIEMKHATKSGDCPPFAPPSSSGGQDESSRTSDAPRDGSCSTTTTSQKSCSTRKWRSPQSRPTPWSCIAPSAERDYASSYVTNGPRDAPSPSPNCTISPSTKPSPSTTTCCTSLPTSSARTW